MAPIATKPKLKHKPSRRSIEELDFDGGLARQIEQKRNSGQISCAECRRLKIRCDKRIPCQSCQRRGCAALCPNGSLATGQGTRFVLAATEHLHRRVAKMGERIRQLEDALGELQAKHSTEPHPLLRPDLIGGSRRDMEGPLLADEEPAIWDQPPELVEAMGTLSINGEGTSRFFGPTGALQCLLMGDNVSQDVADGSTTNSMRDSKSPELPHAIQTLSQAFPFKLSSSIPSARDIIEKYLPTWERASRLADIYLEQASWLFRSVTREQIKNELLPDYYANGELILAKRNISPHRLGLLFLIFGIGALVDLEPESGNAEVEHFHQCARAAISLQSVIERPSLETIQAMHLLSTYNALSGNELSGKETNMETTWSLVPLAAHLSQTIGLHRDSSRWGLSPDIIQRRRVLFWDLFVSDAWHSLDTGRPPTFFLPYINCKYPESPGVDDRGEVDKQVPYGSWVIRFSSECVAEVALRTLTSDSPSYSSIMELDRRVREFPVADAVAEFVAAASGAAPSRPDDKNMGITESMGRFIMSNAREVLLLYLHRSYFAQAITENPANPLNSTYTPSFLAAYRASQTILHTNKVQFNFHNGLIARFCPFWTYAFSAAIVFGTIVTRGPRSPLASSAMKELHDICQLFSKGALMSRRAQRALPIVSRLSEKARNALVLAQGDLPLELGQKWSAGEDEGHDELDIFAGRSKFVSTNRQADATAMSSGRSPTSGGSGKQSNPNPDPTGKMTAPPLYNSTPMASVGASSWVHPVDVEPGLPEVVSQWEQSHYHYPPLQPTIVPPPHSTQTQLSGYHHPTQPALSAPLSSAGLYRLPGVASRSQSHLPQGSYEQPPVYYGDVDMRPPLLAPPELAQLGLVTQETRLDQRWTSFMRESGYFED